MIKPLLYTAANQPLWIFDSFLSKLRDLKKDGEFYGRGLCTLYILCVEAQNWKPCAEHVDLTKLYFILRKNQKPDVPACLMLERIQAYKMSVSDYNKGKLRARILLKECIEDESSYLDY